ncbi:hypothetical protein [Bacillus sp. AK128]
MYRIISLVFIILLMVPASSIAAKTCTLPCHHYNDHINIQIKEIKTPHSPNNNSLWIQVLNNEHVKQQVSIDGYFESSILDLKLPLFTSVIINELPQDKDFIFQQYYEPASTKKIGLLLNWKEKGQLYSDMILVDFE